MARRPASPRVLAVARGDVPADLLVTGGRVLSPATREWVETDLAVADGVIAGWGPREAREVVDVAGAALTPGFIDAHMHLESTKLWVDEFVRTVLPLGTTAVAADPHEIANVFGIPGVAALVGGGRAACPSPSGCAPRAACRPRPSRARGPSCSPPTCAALMDEHGAIGVAEVMNFPGVVAGDPEMLARIATAGGRRVDGHAPGLSGRPLDAYLAAGVESDHECTTLEEAEEKRRKGMWVFIRQGSASQNLAALIPTVLAHGTDHVALCTDDREPDTLLAAGPPERLRGPGRGGRGGRDRRPGHGHGQPGGVPRLRPSWARWPRATRPTCSCFDELAGFRPSRVFQRGPAGGHRWRDRCPGAVPAAPPPGLDAPFGPPGRAARRRRPSTWRRPRAAGPARSAWSRAR